MPTAKKLPSGNYRVQVFSHKEGNKRVYKSFTAPTKREAELIASQYKNGKHVIYEDKTVNEAVEGYISAKEGESNPIIHPGKPCI